MARKGQFKKGGGRVGDGQASRKSSKARRQSTALVRVPSRSVMPMVRNDIVIDDGHFLAHRPTHHLVGRVRSGGGGGGGGGGGATKRRRGGKAGHGITLVKIATAAAALGATFGAQAMAPQSVRDVVAKAPGVKTFGAAPIVGLMAGGIYKFTKMGGKYRPWLGALGVVGVVSAAMKIGDQGTNFKYLGDGGDSNMTRRRYGRDGIMDVET